jgi:hypothetical protein
MRISRSLQTDGALRLWRQSGRWQRQCGEWREKFLCTQPESSRRPFAYETRMVPQDHCQCRKSNHAVIYTIISINGHLHVQFHVRFHKRFCIWCDIRSTVKSTADMKSYTKLNRFCKPALNRSDWQMYAQNLNLKLLDTTFVVVGRFCFSRCRPNV